MATEGSQQVEVFHDPLAAIRGARQPHGLACQIEVKSPSNIQAILCDEQPKRSPNPRIHVQQLVLAIAPVVTEIDIDNAPIADGLHEVDSGLPDGFVRQTDAKGSGSSAERALAHLSARQP